MSEGPNDDICEMGSSPIESKTWPKNYPSLRLIARLSNFLAVLVVFVCIIAFLGVIFSEGEWSSKIPTLGYLFVHGVLGTVILSGIAELIMLLFDIEENTRRKR